jgi:hypothetical protein
MGAAMTSTAIRRAFFICESLRNGDRRCFYQRRKPV